MMKKYEIYSIGSTKPFTEIEADDFVINCEKNMVRFVKGDFYVACFNFSNIAGFKEV